MDKEKLAKKMEFLKTVAMPGQTVLTQSVKDYMKYRKTELKSLEGCYKFLVRKGVEDLAEISSKENSARDARLKEKLDIIKTKKEVEDKCVECFRHVWIGKVQEHTECRLYLRIKPNNMHQLLDKIIDESLKRDVPLYFKYTTVARNDNLVFYTDYEHVQEIVDILEKVYQKNPSLFTGAEKLPPLCGKIGGFIGFMEEPQKEVSIQREGATYPHTLEKSANTYRTRLLDSIADFYEKKGFEPQFMTIRNIQQFSEPLDINPRFTPLNNSTVEELEKAGCNIGLIGTQPTDIFSKTME